MRRCLRTEFAPEGVAALARSLFPNAASLRCAGLPGGRRCRVCAAATAAPQCSRLPERSFGLAAAGLFLQDSEVQQGLGPFPHPRRVSLITGDPSVLACLGSLLAPGPLRLGLLPTGASASGASVLRRAPIYLTAETRWTGIKKRARCRCKPAERAGVWQVATRLNAFGTDRRWSQRGDSGSIVPCLQSQSMTGGVPIGPFQPPTHREAQGLACYDFEGGSVFALPLLEAQGADPVQAAAAAARMGSPPAASAPPELLEAQQQQQQQWHQLQQRQARCIGAVLLSFPAAQPGTQHPRAGLDAGHARNLQLLAAALAPGAAAAAAPLLGHCNLMLGVQAAEQPREGQQEEGEGSDSDASVMLTDSEEEDWEEGERVVLDGGGVPSRERAAAVAAEAEGEQPPAPPLPWAAGGCRGGSDEPPEDPGASSAAVLAAAPQPESEGEPSGHGGGRWQHAQQAQREPLPLPESPTVAKARARVEAAGLEAAAAASSAAAGPHPAAASSVSSSGPQSSLGSLHTASSWDSQQQPPAKPSPEASEEGDSPRSAAEVPLERLAGATWPRLLRFADPRLEASFAARLAAELWKVGHGWGRVGVGGFRRWNLSSVIQGGSRNGWATGARGLPAPSSCIISGSALARFLPCPPKCAHAERLSTNLSAVSL